MAMSCIKDLLSGVCPDVEAGLKPYFKEWITGAIVRSGLPQYWVFRTETEIVTLHVSKEGKARVKNIETKSPDVTVEWTHDYLASVLTNRSSQEIPSGEKPKYTIHTTKGGIGFEILKNYLGL